MDVGSHPVCVRYTLHQFDAALARIAQALQAPVGAPDWVQPRFNVGIAQVAPVVTKASGTVSVQGMMWGLVRDSRGAGNHSRILPNAKAETVLDLASFRTAAQKRRCLVPANGFYEWQRRGKERLPQLFTLKGEEPFAFAGIWDEAAGNLPASFSILTTEPNRLVARIHDRMPVILSGQAMSTWMGEGPMEPGRVAEIARPYAAELMEVRPVSRYVNNGRNEGPHCLDPAEPETGELGLE